MKQQMRSAGSYEEIITGRGAVNNLLTTAERAHEGAIVFRGWESNVSTSPARARRSFCLRRRLGATTVEYVPAAWPETKTKL